MKTITKFILQYYLKFWAKVSLLFHKPIVIAVTGSTNKIFTRQAIIKSLRESGFKVRSHSKSFNTEIGISLAILNLPSGYNSYFAWLPAIVFAPYAAFKKKYPQFLVLEMGISDPGDMKFLLSIVRPDIGIITDINQRYIEAFKTIDALSAEYSKFAHALRSDGALILNIDNSKIEDINKNLEAPNKISFALQGEASYRAIDIEKNREGINFILERGGEDVSIDRFGEHHIYAFLAARATRDYAEKIYNKRKEERVVVEEKV